jgi:hypothetical protein
MLQERGLGKCTHNHVSSYGYPTRPPEPFPFCSQCGEAMVWACAKCGTALPEDSEELAIARFCRECGSSYFDTPTDEPGSTSGSPSP